MLSVLLERPGPNLHTATIRRLSPCSSRSWLPLTAATLLCSGQMPPPPTSTHLATCERMFLLAALAAHLL